MFNPKLTLICLLEMFSLLLFLYGFFPLQSKILKNRSSPEDFSFYDEFENGTCDQVDEWKASHSKSPTKSVDNIVLMVIDALRFDFVFDQDGKPNGRMEFVKELIDSGFVHGYEARVQPPTVTMPRIKAITAGVVPAFADVVLNFASSEFAEDNLISSAVRADRRLRFYGDDTWLKLFPHHFERFDGVTSFVVTDYTEVDDNVTRHLPESLNESNEWDTMILHYIGLDHIGHTSGPSSPLVSTKLAEMDEVIRRIYSGLKEAGRTFSIIVLGDHGMTDVGSHGGASQQETIVPIVFISSTKRSESGSFAVENAQQVDLTPTLAYLNRLPIPVNNVGILLTSVVEHHLAEGQFASVDLVDLVRQNAKAMLRVYRNNVAEKEWTEVNNHFNAITDDFRRWIKAELCHQVSNDLKTMKQGAAIRHRYLRLMEDVRHRLITSSINYNDAALIAGMIAFAIFVLLSLGSCRRIIAAELATSSESQRRFYFLITAVVLHALSFASSSFVEEEHMTWYFMLETFLILVLFDAIAILHRSKTASPKAILSSCASVALLRILRVWNRAGIKWRDSESLADWFLRPDNRSISALVIGFSAIGLFTVSFRRARGAVPRILLAIGASLIVFYRLGIFHSWAVTFVQMVYILCAIFGLIRQPMLSAVLLSSVMVKLPNLPVLFLVLLIQSSMNCGMMIVRSSSFERICGNYFLSMVAYFALGNSNSIGHVDVASGYVGFSAYSPIINGLLIAAHLYAGPMLVAASSRGSTQSESTRQDHRGFYMILALKGFPTAFYLVMAYFQRYHLFVWSVFAPKLLYESMHMGVICVLSILLQFF